MSRAWTMTERAYRRAMGKAAFSETQLRVVDKIIFYSAGRERMAALIPKQIFLAKLCGLDAGEVSKALDFLEGKQVIERQSVDVHIQGRREKWCLFALLPPPWLRMDARTADARAVEELEGWLESLDVEQAELLPAPLSLADALRENFVESRVESQVESRESAKASSRLSTDPDVVATGPSGPVARVFSRVGDYPSVPGEVGDSPSAEVGDSPSRSPSSTRDRDSAQSRSQSRDRVLGLESKAVRSLDRQAAVERYLFETIGEQERRGRCAILWRNAVRSIPEELDELIGHARMLKRERPETNVAAWLNRAVYNELQRGRR